MTEQREITCARCLELEQQLHDAEANLAELGSQFAGAQLQLRRAGAVETKLRTEIAKIREEDPASQDVRLVLEEWQALHPRARCPMDGKRAKDVRKALRWGFTVEQLQKALHGLSLLPYVGPKGRSAVGLAAQRFDDVEYALSDEQRIEKWIAYVDGLAQAQETPEEPVSDQTGPDAHRPAERPQRTGPREDPLPLILARLDGLSQVGADKWNARCPAHDDSHASMSLGRGDQAIVAHCHAGCTGEQIADAIGIPLRDWFYEACDGAVSHEQRRATARVAATQTKPARQAEQLPTEAELKRMQQALAAHDRLTTRLRELKGWSRTTLIDLGIGWYKQRVAIPIRDAEGVLQTMAYYQPNGKPKMLGLKGRDRGLFPAPETLGGHEVWIVEGEPDAITGHELGIPAVSVPGVNNWKDAWVGRFAGRKVVIVMDCDEQGRKAADRLSKALADVTAELRVIDLATDRDDHYDLTDFALDGGTADLLRQSRDTASVVQQLRKAA